MVQAAAWKASARLAARVFPFSSGRAVTYPRRARSTCLAADTRSLMRDQPQAAERFPRTFIRSGHKDGRHSQGCRSHSFLKRGKKRAKNQLCCPSWPRRCHASSWRIKDRSADLSMRNVADFTARHKSESIPARSSAARALSRPRKCSAPSSTSVTCAPASAPDAQNGGPASCRAARLRSSKRSHWMADDCPPSNAGRSRQLMGFTPRSFRSVWCQSTDRWQPRAASAARVCCERDRCAAGHR